MNLVGPVDGLVSSCSLSWSRDSAVSAEGGADGLIMGEGLVFVSGRGGPKAVDPHGRYPFIMPERSILTGSPQRRVQHVFK
jgi:hypothetical protein